MDDFKSIKVFTGKNSRDLEVVNPTSYPFIGKGYQGAVFQLNERQCVKIYPKPGNVEREAKALKAVQQFGIAPKLFETGPNYIVMEYIKGPTLKIYLRQKGGISESISRQLVSIIKNMQAAGFTRIDFYFKNMIVTDNEVLKVIDLVDFTSRPKRPSLIRMFQQLKSLGMLVPFLEHAEKFEPQMAAQWKQAFDFDKLELPGWLKPWKF